MDRGTWRATVHGVTRVGHDLATKPPPKPSVESTMFGVVEDCKMRKEPLAQPSGVHCLCVESSLLSKQLDLNTYNA